MVYKCHRENYNKIFLMIAYRYLYLDKEGSIVEFLFSPYFLLISQSIEYRFCCLGGV